MVQQLIHQKIAVLFLLIFSGHLFKIVHYLKTNFLMAGIFMYEFSKIFKKNKFLVDFLC